MILGQDAMQSYELNFPAEQRTQYNENTNPSIANSFTTAAYRFGHSLIQGLVEMRNTRTGTQVKQYCLRDHFFNDENYLAYGGLGMEMILKGLIGQPMQTFDRQITQDVSNFLFTEFGNSSAGSTAKPDQKCHSRGHGKDFGGDLISRNLQRGRDHGLPDYNDWRKFCGLNPLKSMKSRHRPKEISPANWAALRKLYSSHTSIDIFPAGLAETPVNGGLTGHTFNCIKANQFKHLKFGDRFFLSHGEQAGSFSFDQLLQLRSRTLRDLICENTGIKEARDNVFLQGGTARSCDQVNKLDIDLFLGFIPGR